MNRREESLKNTIFDILSSNPMTTGALMVYVSASRRTKATTSDVANALVSLADKIKIAGFVNNTTRIEPILKIDP